MLKQQAFGLPCAAGLVTGGDEYVLRLDWILDESHPEYGLAPLWIDLLRGLRCDKYPFHHPRFFLAFS